MLGNIGVFTDGFWFKKKLVTIKCNVKDKKKKMKVIKKIIKK